MTASELTEKAVQELIDEFLFMYPAAHFGPGHVLLSDGNWETAADFERLRSWCNFLGAYMMLEDSGNPLSEALRAAYITVYPYYNPGYEDEADIVEDSKIFRENGNNAVVLAFTARLCRGCEWQLNGCVGDSPWWLEG